MSSAVDMGDRENRVAEMRRRILMQNGRGDEEPSPEAGQAMETLSDDGRSQQSPPTQTVETGDIGDADANAIAAPAVSLAEPDVIAPDEIPASVLEVKLRADGTLPNAPLSQEMRTAIIKTYEENLGINMREVASALGVGLATVCRTLDRAPALVEQARQKRRTVEIEDIAAGLSDLALSFREDAASGKLRPGGEEARNFRDWAIGYGVMTDKFQLITGGATSRPDKDGQGTLVEKKQAMLDVLDRAEAVMTLNQRGRDGRKQQSRS